MSPSNADVAIAAAARPVDGRRRGAPPAPPSIWTLLSTTGSIESLAAMRAQILEGVRSGEIAPSERTLLRWAEAIYVRVLELMALQPRQAPYIYNVTLTWPKPPEIAAAFEEQMHLVTAPLPSDAERLRLQGIAIEGVTP